MPQFAVILPAAGKSVRFAGNAEADSRQRKVFVNVAGRPVWVRAAEAFDRRSDVLQTIVVVSPDDEEWFRHQFKAFLSGMNVDVVTGGAERADSVERALAAVCDEVDFIAVHDAARPLVSTALINEVFEQAVACGAAILAEPMTSTIKRVDAATREILATLPREELWAAQTPQVFRRDWLVEAYAKRGALQPTDEAQLVAAAGHPVCIVPGSSRNLKITTQEDLRIAEALCQLMPSGEPHWRVRTADQSTSRTGPV